MQASYHQTTFMFTCAVAPSKKKIGFGHSLGTLEPVDIQQSVITPHYQLLKFCKLIQAICVMTSNSQAIWLPLILEMILYSLVFPSFIYVFWSCVYCTGMEMAFKIKQRSQNLFLEKYMHSMRPSATLDRAFCFIKETFQILQRSVPVCSNLCFATNTDVEKLSK